MKSNGHGVDIASKMTIHYNFMQRIAKKQGGIFMEFPGGISAGIVQTDENAKKQKENEFLLVWMLHFQNCSRIINQNYPVLEREDEGNGCYFLQKQGTASEKL